LDRHLAGEPECFARHERGALVGGAEREPPPHAAAARGAAVRPGVDVMITIFRDFSTFSAKKLAFFTNTNVSDKILT
jgi:hypothetical protein